MVNHLLSNVFIETLDQAIDGVVVIDSNNRILLYNQAAEKLWGYAKAEVKVLILRLLLKE